MTDTDSWTNAVLAQEERAEVAEDGLDEMREMLREAEEYLGGYMGPHSSYQEVERLRERIRAALGMQRGGL